jgi:hypothetical protein
MEKKIMTEDGCQVIQNAHLAFGQLKTRKNFNGVFSIVSVILSIAVHNVL